MKQTSKRDDKDLCRIITPEFRVSYPHVFKPQAPNANDKPKFSITMLFDKKSDLTGSTVDGEPRKLLSVVTQAKLLEFGSKEKWPEDLEKPYVDGDKPKRDGTIPEGYSGHWVFKATSAQDQRPSVVDRDMTPITDPAILYPGCYARAYIFAYVWFYPNRNKPMKKGVGFILDHVQKTRDGKSFGGKMSVEQVFKPLTGQIDDEEVETSEDESF